MLATSTWMLDHAWLVPLLPALGFLIILLFGKRLRYQGSEVGLAAVGASWVLACWTTYEWISRVSDATDTHGAGAAIKAFGRSAFESGTGHEPLVKPIYHSITWWQSGGMKFDFGIQVDGLAVMMFFVVTTVSLLAHIFSTAYMRGDRRYTHYFAALSLFTASMLLLVVSDNTLGLLLGWEGTSVCSFMLIGHWWEERENSSAALKAMFTTRTGDIGLLIGLAMCYWFTTDAYPRLAAGNFFGITHSSGFAISEINRAALSGKVGHTVLLVTAIALFAAVIGKSAQFALHTWLPDAMAGPTPVSALIHAATMVVAGVYLVARLYPVFWKGFSILGGGLNLMAVIGGITILVAAFIAFVQDDIKKVLAYSTISQLGYMVMGLGVGAWTAALFHLFTHAFFKAGLFLGAGSVSHSGSHHSFDMKRDMGGLRKYMPTTFWTFVICSVALAGIFPFAGFWSKDEIISTSHVTGYDIFLVVGLVGAFLTAAYMMRCIYLTFLGQYRGNHHPRESERLITFPLIVLAAFSIFAGFANAPMFGIESFRQWVEPRATAAFNVFPLDIVHPEFDSTAGILALVSVLVALAGFGLVWAFYAGKFKGLENLTERNGAARAVKRALENKLYLDHLYTNVIVGAIKKPIAGACYWIDQNVIDGFASGVSGSAADSAGRLVRRSQSGKVQRYAMAIFVAVGVLALAVFLAN